VRQADRGVLATSRKIPGYRRRNIVKDINREERKLSIIGPVDPSDYTRYFLDNPRKAHRIEVFVLKDYLSQKLKLEFRPRTAADIY
jgi:hypothetical protein